VNTTLGTTALLTAGDRRQMLERVNHEIRTPLTSLLGHVEMLEENSSDLPFRVEISLHAISRAGDRLRDLLARLDETVAELSA